MPASQPQSCASHPFRRLCATLLLATVAAIAHGAPEWRWQSVDGAAATVRASGGTYTLIGTAGQPDAAATASGAAYSLRPGFWPGVAQAPQPDALLANGFE
jgi:hypothetical protein